MLANIDLRCVYNVIFCTEAYLGYKPAMDNPIKRTVNKIIFVKDGSEVKVII